MNDEYKPYGEVKTLREQISVLRGWGLTGEQIAIELNLKSSQIVGYHLRIMRQMYYDQKVKTKHKLYESQ
jgi:hypothetical protein